ncbi:hypothetical protein NDU88_001779 [Pleurodeles waltl]|uniref:SCAN box domain-containing protein n=1 Tax=Pleurodeles waltl TaxID=8319 RepID=A0AAV7NG47_PLEWA|nr:hypothetical protein NDU88_001779 [Pleurodeles waltl]
MVDMCQEGREVYLFIEAEAHIGILRRALFNFEEADYIAQKEAQERDGSEGDPRETHESSEDSEEEGPQSTPQGDSDPEELDTEGEDDWPGMPVEREDPIDRESLTGSLRSSSATSHSLSPEELRDRREERDQRLQLARLAVEERQAEVEKALVQERMAEAERAFARERLALERSLTNLDSPVMQGKSSGGSICSVRHNPYLPTDLVPGFKQGDAMRQWLREYEESVVACRIPEKDWGTVLESYIPEVERDVLLAPEGSDRQGYPNNRKAQIEKYGLTPEDYRLRFRGSRKRSHQSWEDFMGTCRKALKGWVEGSRATTYEGLFSLILREHMFRCCFSELRQHLSNCEFSDPRELAKEADLWLSARGAGQRPRAVLGSLLEGVGEVLGLLPGAPRREFNQPRQRSERGGCRIHRDLSSSSGLGRYPRGSPRREGSRYRRPIL